MEKLTSQAQENKALELNQILQILLTNSGKVVSMPYYKFLKSFRTGDEFSNIRDITILLKQQEHKLKTLDLKENELAFQKQLLIQIAQNITNSLNIDVSLINLDIN